MAESLMPCRKCKKGFTSENLITEVISRYDDEDGKGKIPFHSYLCQDCTSELEWWFADIATMQPTERIERDRK